MDVCELEAMPAADRLDRFDQCQQAAPQPMRASSDRPEHFAATVREFTLDQVELLQLTSAQVEMRRTSQLIRQQDPELYSVVVPVRGTLALEHREHRSAVEPGQIAVYDSSHPVRARIVDSCDLLQLQVPVAALPVDRSRIDRLLGEPIPATSGIPALLVAMLARVVADEPHGPADALRIGGVLLDLIAAALMHRLEADVHPAPAEGAQLIVAVDSFIQHNLGDPQLTPTTIAGAQHISVSYLHKLFRTRGTTVAASIRRQRLERARRELADPINRTVPVRMIGTRWGFADHATFSRAFRSAYGITPSDYRMAGSRLESRL